MKTLKSFVEELDNIVPSKSKHAVVESRATHIIASAVNLIRLIKESYPDEVADDLIKRLYRSIINEDDKKFMRKIKELRKTEND
jgi:hypothetical protein